MKRLGLGLLFFLLASPTFASDIVINELFSPSSSDWVEIYNISNSVIPLDGWEIHDTTGKVHGFASSLLLPVGGYCVADVSNRLNNNGDKIQLFQGSAIQDCVAYGDGNGSFCNAIADIAAASDDKSIARKPDGTGSWVVSSQTSGYSNEATIEPAVKVLCYAPTPTPTFTPTPSPTESPTPNPTSAPTNAPTSTKTPTPIKTPTPAVVKTPTKKLSPTMTDSPTPEATNAGDVLSLSDSVSPMPPPDGGATPSGSLQPIIITFSLVGAGLGLLSLLFLWQKRDMFRKKEPPSDIIS